MSMIAPNGRPAVIRTFGNPIEYVENKEAWERLILTAVPLRYPLPYAYGSATITLARGHRLVIGLIVEALARCHEAGVADDRLLYGGIYCWRAIRGFSSLSMHTWGIAIDLAPQLNPLGTPWRDDGVMLPSIVIAIFEDLGFTWGGRWSRPDPQHFQFASGC